MESSNPQKTKHELENFIVFLEKIVDRVETGKTDINKIPRLISKLEGKYQPISSHILDIFPKSDWYIDGARKMIKRHRNRLNNLHYVA